MAKTKKQGENSACVTLFECGYQSNKYGMCNKTVNLPFGILQSQSSGKSQLVSVLQKVLRTCHKQTTDGVILDLLQPIQPDQKRDYTW